MPSKVVKWLAAFKPSSSESIEELASWMCTNVKLLEDIEEVLEKLSSSLIPEVCQRLFIFYRSPSASLHKFAVFFLPSLIYSYLSHVLEDDISMNNRKSVGPPTDAQQNCVITNLASLESSLIGITRCLMLLKPQIGKSCSFQTDSTLYLPSLNESSVFHNSVTSKDGVTGLNEVPLTLSLSGARNRAPAIAYLIRDYRDTLTSTNLLTNTTTLLSLHSMMRFCRLCDRVASLTQRPRIPQCPSLLTDLLMGLDTILYKLDDIDKRTDTVRRSSLAIRSAVWGAIKEIEKRATYSCLSRPLLICRVIFHSRTAQYGSRAVPGLWVGSSVDGCVDIGSLLTSADDHSQINGPDMSKVVDGVRGARPHHSGGVEVITNASFRPEMLPEDIPCNEQKSSHQERITNATDKPEKIRKGPLNGKPSTVDNRNRAGGHRQEQVRHTSGAKLMQTALKKSVDG